MGKIGDLWVRLGLKSEDFAKGLNDATGNVKSFGQQIGSAVGTAVAGFASVTAAIAGVVHIVKEAVKTIGDFERANSNLAAILGTTKAGIVDLSKAAMDLGRRTEFTSSEVTALQTEFAKLGFLKPQILDMEESVLKFAAAVGADLASASSFAGASLRSFGLEAQDMPQLLDILAKSCTSSALDFSKLATAIPIAGSTAYAFGLNVKQLTAMLGVLANRGIDASSAATALRNIFLDAAKSNSKLAETTGIQIKNYEDVFKALQKMNDAGMDLSQIMGAANARTVGAIAALSGEIDSIKGLEDAFTNAAGTVDKMYVTATDNAVGASKQLASAWEGLILQFRSIDEPLKNVKIALANILNGISDILASPFWDSKLWQGWKTGAKTAADAFKSYFAPVASLMDRIGRLFGGSRNAKSAETSEPAEDNTPIVFDESDPYFIGPVRPKKKTAALLSDEELEKIQKEKDKAFKAELQLISEEAQALREEEALYDELAASALDSFERQHGIIHDSLDASTRDLINFVDNAQAQADILQESLDEIQDAIIADLNPTKFLDSIDTMSNAAVSLAETLQRELIAAFDELAQAIASGEQIGGAQLAKALLTPLADMAVSLGTIVMMSGEAMEALKDAMVNLFGGGAVGAVVAGAALIGVGIAAKAGIAALATGGSASSTTAVSAGQMATNYGASTAELTVFVKGEIKGSNIVLSGEAAQAEWNK